MMMLADEIGELPSFAEALTSLVGDATEVLREHRGEVERGLTAEYQEYWIPLQLEVQVSSICASTGGRDTCCRGWS